MFYGRHLIPGKKWLKFLADGISQGIVCFSFIFWFRSGRGCRSRFRGWRYLCWRCKLPVYLVAAQKTAQQEQKGNGYEQW